MLCAALGTKNVINGRLSFYVECHFNYGYAIKPRIHVRITAREILRIQQLTVRCTL